MLLPKQHVQEEVHGGAGQRDGHKYHHEILQRLQRSQPSLCRRQQRPYAHDAHQEAQRGRLQHMTTEQIPHVKLDHERIHQHQTKRLRRLRRRHQSEDVGADEKRRQRQPERNAHGREGVQHGKIHSALQNFGAATAARGRARTLAAAAR
eukprot:scaffold1850_cov194-Pinguiococcus_pyrenoidosus.AAC.38